MPLPFLALAFTLSALATPPNSAYITYLNKMGRYVQQSIAVSDEVWPGARAKFEAANIIMSDGTNVLGLHNGQFTPLTRAAFPKDMALDGFAYDFGEHGEVYFVAPQGDLFSSADDAASVLMHEGFHKLIQDDTWNAHPRDISDIYPVQVKARAYRHAILRTLEDALLNPDQRSRNLARASYFTQQWQRQFPNDYQDAQSTDVIEGSALYFEKNVQLRRTLSSDELNTPAALKKFIAQHDEQMGLDLGNHSESYMLGFLSGSLLDLTTQSKDWQTQLPTGKTPLSLLLAGIKPMPTPLAPEDWRAAQDYRADVEKQVKDRLSQVFRAIDKGQPLLRVPYQQVGSTYQQGDFKRLNDIGSGLNYTILKSGIFQTTQGLLTLKDTVILNERPKVGSHQLLLPLNPTWIGRRGNAITLHYPGAPRPFTLQVGTPLRRSKVYILKP